MEEILLLDALRRTMREEIQPVTRQLDKIEVRLDSLETQMDALETHIDGLDTRMDALGRRMEGLEESIQETRGAANQLLAWAEDAAISLHIPLFRQTQ